jgi:uncharacterized membrane protein
MSTASIGTDAIERYLLRLNAALLSVPTAEREEFLREIRGHIFERLEQSSDVAAILAAVGDPEELAEQFRAETSLARSAHSWSALVLMRTAVRWALSGAQGFSIFMVALIGYGLAASFYISAILKPIFPKNIGIFAYDTTFNIGFDNAPQRHDISGPYFTLYAMIAGFLLVFATSSALRAMMRKFARVKSRFAAVPGESIGLSLPLPLQSRTALAESVRSLPWWRLLRLAARGAVSGLQGFLMFMVAVFGYVLGGVLCLTAVFKPVFPDNIGFFVSNHGIQLATWPRPQGVEVAGQYYTAIAMLLGIVFIFATNFVLRHLMQNFGRLKRSLA